MTAMPFRKGFRPGWGVTVSALLALGILISLGTWQALKVGPKTALVEKVSAFLHQAPVPLETVGTPAPYRRVEMTGRFADAAPVRVYGTSTAGKAGYHLYLPFLRAGQVPVMVSPGWVPAHEKTLPPIAGEKTVTVTGATMLSARPGPFTPANDPARGNWYLADVREMARHFGLTDVHPLRVLLEDTDPEALPVGGQVRVDIPNDHFEYALTWYGIALALIAVYLAYGFSRPLK
ncbi:surfeit locus 1 family protein [Eilatimonas milleporae]|uniref:SURF1-like protein n=2 Tax=Eilatimonas milleporae TaxID=911205 RepID=A0A3M0C7H6_9PROT|nr:surfeit locus 1 family protein [Eilatimonas milleporae]